MAEVGPAAGGGDFFLQLLAQRHTAADEGREPGRIEIHVGQGREGGLEREPVCFGRVDGMPARGLGNERQPLERVEEQILQGGHLGRLSADADLGAAFPFGGLFALIAKHGNLLSKVVGSV
jgi:hypothetical protein